MLSTLFLNCDVLCRVGRGEGPLRTAGRLQVGYGLGRQRGELKKNITMSQILRIAAFDSHLLLQVHLGDSIGAVRPDRRAKT